MKSIVLVGGGGHARACISLIESAREFDIVGIIDSTTKSLEDLLGYQYLGDDSELARLVDLYRHAHVSVGQVGVSEVRSRLYDQLVTAGAIMPALVSKNAYVERRAEIGPGTAVMPGAVLNTRATVGKNSIINSRALLEHDVKIGDHCHISTGAIVNGGTTIGSGTFIGSGSVIFHGISIGVSCVIPAGSVVKRDLSNHERHTN